MRAGMRGLVPENVWNRLGATPPKPEAAQLGSFDLDDDEKRELGAMWGNSFQRTLLEKLKSQEHQRYYAQLRRSGAETPIIQGQMDALDTLYMRVEATLAEPLE